MSSAECDKYLDRFVTEKIPTKGAELKVEEITALLERWRKGVKVAQPVSTIFLRSWTVTGNVH